MARTTVRRVTKRTYHHGDLERALVDTALLMIQQDGIQALTLRGVGAAMAAAYAQFARSHPSHYETMFSGVLTDSKRYPELQRCGEAAFTVLVDTIRRGQAQGRIRRGNPVQLAEVTWALSHGIASLGMAGQLPAPPQTLEEFAMFGWKMLEQGLQP